jgi:hypothetical protein
MYLDNERRHLDALCRRYTVAETLDELCDLGSETGYVPSLYGDCDLVNRSGYVPGLDDYDDDVDSKRHLADAYDARQQERGDPRRAYRG